MRNRMVEFPCMHGIKEEGTQRIPDVEEGKSLFLIIEETRLIV